MANGRALVTPPPFTPLQFGLLSTAFDATAGAPAHWEAGVTWQSHCPDAGATYDPCLITAATGDDAGSPAPDPDDKAETSELILRGATPFAVYTRLDCSPVGFWDRAQQLAEEAIVRVEGHQVEQAFSTGSAGGQADIVYPHLEADASVDDSTGAILQPAAEVLSETVVDIVEAIGLIEFALGQCYHGQGVIHVPAILGSSLAAFNLTTRRGAQQSSPTGHSIALGTGYDGGSPDGVPQDGIAWIYATGAVFYYRSAVTVHRQVDSFDRDKNTLEALAERRYVLGWDCCLFAVPVTVGGVEQGEVGGPGPIGP